MREGSGVEESVRCGCHVKVVDNTTRKAVIKLVLAAVIAVLFMIGEVIGEGRGCIRGICESTHD